MRGVDAAIGRARKAVRRAVDLATGARWRHLHRAEGLLALAAGVVRPRVDKVALAKERQDRRLARQQAAAQAIELQKKRLELKAQRESLKAKKEKKPGNQKS